MKKNTQVRYRGGIKSPVLSEVKKKDEVVVLEEGDNWKKSVQKMVLSVMSKTVRLKRPRRRISQGNLKSRSIQTFHLIIRLI